MKQLILALMLSCGQLGLSQTSKDTLAIGYTPAPPFVIQENNKLQGINIWLWEQVANDLQIPYSLYPMSFSAMLDSLKKGSIDVSINPLTITSERSKEIGFTHSFYASNSTIAVSEIGSFQRVKRFIGGFLNVTFLRGFLVLLGIIVVFGLAGWFFERKKNPQQFRPGLNGIWDGLWWSIVTLTTVGYGDKAPTSRKGKITALILMFTGLLFISGLTASIASSLTVTQLNSNPDSFNEFKDREVGSIANSSSAAFLRSQFFKKVKLYETVTNGLEDLHDNKLEAFMYDEPILRYRIKQDPRFEENVSILPVKFDVQFYAFGFSDKRDSLRRLVSQKVLERIETEEWQIILHEYGLTEL